jgi:hypothetical protein
VNGSHPWLVTRHADVRAVLADQRFSADTLLSGHPATSPGVLARRKESPSFIAMDDPDHAFFRRMLISESSRTSRSATRWSSTGCTNCPCGGDARPPTTTP